MGMVLLSSSSLTKALVVHTKINGSAVNFLPCDPTVSNCESKANLIGCNLEACKATNCPDGSLAPILPGNCCPDTSLCPAKNCAAIGCLVELCPNGQTPLVYNSLVHPYTYGHYGYPYAYAGYTGYPFVY